jgi:hypothetical protein
MMCGVMYKVSEQPVEEDVECSCANQSACDNAADEDCPQHEPRCTCNGSEEPCDHCAQYLADKAEEEIWCGTDEPLYECQVCG